MISTRVWRRSCASVSEGVDKNDDDDNGDDVPELEDFAIFVQLILLLLFSSVLINSHPPHPLCYFIFESFPLFHSLFFSLSPFLIPFSLIFVF